MPGVQGQNRRKTDMCLFKTTSISGYIIRWKIEEARGNKIEQEKVKEEMPRPSECECPLKGPESTPPASTFLGPASPQQHRHSGNSLGPASKVISLLLMALVVLFFSSFVFWCYVFSLKSPIQ